MPKEFVYHGLGHVRSAVCIFQGGGLETAWVWAGVNCWRDVRECKDPHGKQSAPSNIHVAFSDSPHLFIGGNGVSCAGAASATCATGAAGAASAGSTLGATAACRNEGGAQSDSALGWVRGPTAGKYCFYDWLAACGIF